MIFLLLGSTPYQLFSQTVNCPDYSFCLEVDEENCTIEVRLHGVANVPLLSVDLRIFFWDNAPLIDIPTTLSSFQNTPIGMHFANQSFPLPPVAVFDNSVFIQYFPYADPYLTPFITDDDCLVLGTIYFNPGELDCDDEIFSYASQLLSRNSPGPQIWVGNNFPFAYQTCTNYTLDCECLDCPEDWGICMLPDPEPCGNVIPVFLTGLDDEEIAGYRFNMVLDPDIVIDVDATKASWLASNLGGHNWQIKDLSVSYASNGTFLEVFGINLLAGNNASVFLNPEFLLNIYIIPQLGECYQFDENSVSFWYPSGIWKGDNIQDGYLCDNFDLTCGDFEVCFDETILLSGNIERPTIAGSCDEGIDFGFPEGKVTARGTYCGYENEFSTMTSPAGYFEIEVFDNTDYDIIPAYTEAHKYACGVNSIDVDIIREVILGFLSTFPYPFSNLAADMSLDQNITSYDNTLLNRYILEIEYPEAGKWRFLPASQYNSIFVPQNPVGTIVPAYDTKIQFVSGVSQTNNLNFIAVKMGDVNGSCQQCLEGGSLQQDQPNLMIAAKYFPSEERLGLYFKDMQVNNVTVTNLAIDGGNGIKFKSDIVENLITDSEMVFSGNGDLGVSKGWISLLENGITLNYGDEIVSFRVEDFSYTSELTLTLGELVADGRLYYFELDWSEIEIIEGNIGRINHFLSIAPNPGTDKIRISLGDVKEDLVKLQIVDMMGRSIEHHQLSPNNNSINTSNLPPGTYHFLFSSESFNESRIWVKTH